MSGNVCAQTTDRQLAIACDLDEAGMVLADYQAHGYCMAHLCAMQRALRSQATDTATRFSLQHALLMERRDTSAILEARIADQSQQTTWLERHLQDLYDKHQAAVVELRQANAELAQRLAVAEERLRKLANRFDRANIGY